MPFFEKTIAVNPEDLDDLDHVNNVRYVQWIQDISKEHWEQMAPEAMQKTKIWVVMSHTIRYLNAAKLGDNVRIRTYISKNKGAISTREVAMFLEKTDTPLLRSSTEWCLLNAETLRPMRIDQDIERIFMQEK